MCLHSNSGVTDLAMFFGWASGANHNVDKHLISCTPAAGVRGHVSRICNLLVNILRDW